METVCPKPGDRDQEKATTTLLSTKEPDLVEFERFSSLQRVTSGEDGERSICTSSEKPIVMQRDSRDKTGSLQWETL